MSASDPHPPDDPSKTDRLLEQELREAVGDEGAARAMEQADDVRAAHAAPGTLAAGAGTTGEPAASARRGGLTSLITANGPLIGVSFAAFLVIGVILSLATGSWLALVAALVVHAIGTLLVAGLALQMTTETEHVSPELAARLEAEGVVNPDRAFSDLAGGSAGPGDVVRPGANDRTTVPEQDAGEAAREQRTAFTPASEASKPSGGRFVAVVIAVAIVVVAVGAIGLLVSLL